MEAKDSDITSVTSIIYVGMIIQDVSLESMSHTRYVGQTTWTQCGIARVWVNEIFEKIDLKVELTWRYAK